MLVHSLSFLPRDRFQSHFYISNRTEVVSQLPSELKFQAWDCCFGWQGQCKGRNSGESKGGRSQRLRKMLRQAGVGLAQLVQPSLERASQIWLSSGGWVGSGADSGPGKSGDSTRTAVAWVFLENFGCQRLLQAASAPTYSEAGRENEGIFKISSRHGELISGHTLLIPAMMCLENRSRNSSGGLWIPFECSKNH